MAATPDLIFDVGMHTAEDTSYYLAKGYRVVAVDANADLCAAAAERFAQEISDGRLTIVNAAIAQTPGPVTFYQHAHTAWGTTDPAWVARNTGMGAQVLGSVTVPGVAFTSLLAEHGVPHYLKVDIEGADLLCLEGLLEAGSDRPDFVSIESDKRTWKGLLAEFDLFDRLGYRRFKVVDQKHVPDQRARGIAWDFEIGASGLFGNEAPGDWLTRQEAIREYRKIFFRYLVYGEEAPLRRREGLGRIHHKALRTLFGPVSWYDTHAAL